MFFFGIRLLPPRAGIMAILKIAHPNANAKTAGSVRKSGMHCDLEFITSLTSLANWPD